MNQLELSEPFERRRMNRAVLIIVAMVFAAIALNDGIQAFMTRTHVAEIARSMAPAKPAGATLRPDPCDDAALEVH
ncbi:MAG TPA: hypothetical protein VFQ07_11205 [Candidatus Polarisedimenticolia bacterium]|nr:hypothetical protein [Candidatus Polarisedimenticolia bacterium]